MRKKLIEISDVEPVTIDEAKAHLQISHTDDDAYITGLISAARQHIEDFTQRSMMPQKWDVFFDEFPLASGAYPTLAYYGPDPRRRHKPHEHRDEYLGLGVAPLIDILSIEYVDANGATQTLDPTTYKVDDVVEPARVYLAYGKAWPTTRAERNAVIVHCNCGYTDAAAVPPTLKLAIKLLVSNFYENREPIALVAGAQPYEMPLSIQQMLSTLDLNWI